MMFYFLFEVCEVACTQFVHVFRFVSGKKYWFLKAIQYFGSRQFQRVGRTEQLASALREPHLWPLRLNIHTPPTKNCIHVRLWIVLFCSENSVECRF